MREEEGEGGEEENKKAEEGKENASELNALKSYRLAACNAKC